MEMKRCKECGKMFLPTSKRQQYCNELHYRPCPVCGKMVEAKYLSDPARCCSSECKKQLAAKNRRSVVVTAAELADEPLDIKDGQIAEYRGPKVGLWIPGHRYVINIDAKHTTYGQYKIWATKDLTSDSGVKLLMPLSSQNSIDRYFTLI